MTARPRPWQGSHGHASGKERDGPSRRQALAMVLAGAVLHATPADAQDLTTPAEAAVKADHLHKFIAFVEWPAHVLRPNSPFLIGVANADDVFDELLRTLPGRLVLGRPVAARRLDDGNLADGFHVAYLGHEPTDARIRRLQDLSVLVVTDLADGLLRGGTLNFVRVDGKLRFEASVGSADIAGLRLSSRLLAVAERVHGRP